MTPKISARAQSRQFEHGAEKCERFSDDIMLYFPIPEPQ